MNPITIHKIKEHMEFFNAIPASEWCTNRFRTISDNGKPQFCALGHLGVKRFNKLPEKAKELCALLKPVARKIVFWTRDDDHVPMRSVARINDARSGDRTAKVLGDHPKARVMAALKQRLEMEVTNVELEQAGTESHQPGQNLPGVQAGQVS